MRAIDLFPYWADNRALVGDGLDLLGDQDLDVRPAAGLPSIGELLRHMITTEEHWWHGGILGEPWARWRPDGWESFSARDKAAYRASRFPTLNAIRDGLVASHLALEGFLSDFEAQELCEKRRATWGEENTLRWIVWHLVEHDQHHRGQLFVRLRLLGHAPPATFPRPAVMASTPAMHWTEPTDMLQVVPYWKPLFRSLRDAVASLSPADLEYRPAEVFTSSGDLVLHVLVEHDRSLRRMTSRGPDGASGLPAGAEEIPVSLLSRTLGDRWGTGVALADAVDHAHDATQMYLATLEQADLSRTLQTAAGPQTLHHTLWYAREHIAHHRAQLFFQMRMIGRTPPGI